LLAVGALVTVGELKPACVAFVSAEDGCAEASKKRTRAHTTCAVLDVFVLLGERSRGRAKHLSLPVMA